MIVTIELDVSVCHSRFTEHEYLQFFSQATQSQYAQFWHECSVRGVRIAVHKVLEHMGCVIVDVPTEHIEQIRNMTAVKSVRESKFHRMKCDN